ncbi:TonB-dependent receptor plug domain-containing protein [Novosphingobium colocasiae]
MPSAPRTTGWRQGVGYYVDQVYHARPATAAFDFTDVERVEILRGPQGTLFGKNSTAGAISIATRKPQFTPPPQTANFRSESMMPCASGRR